MKEVNFWRIHKYETPQLIKGVNAILSKYDVEMLDVKVWYDILLDQETELSKIKTVAREYPGMNELDDYRKKRRALLSVINTQYSALERARVDQLTAPQAVVLPFLKINIRDLFSNNFKKMNEIVIQMLRTIEEDTALQAALQVVGMKAYFDELKVIQDNITRCKSLAIKFKSEIPKIRTKVLKKPAVDALNNLIKSLELGKIRYPEKDFAPLINELDAFLAEFRMLDKTRRTISKRSAENKKTAASSSTTAATV